jgi:riboflavin synthase alpha subunit
VFTGLVEETGRVAALTARGAEVRLRVRARLAAGLRRGRSIAVDGVCLTAAGRGRGWFEAVLAPETLRRTTLGLRRAGDRVNLERPLRLGDPIGGHLVQGHVDGVGVVEAARPEGSGARVRVAFPAALAPFIHEKGSIAVDGVSLTVAARAGRWFEAALIPETLRVTHLGGYAPGTPVNLEVDMLGRYAVAGLRAALDAAPPPAVTREFLVRHGVAGAFEVGS